MGRWSKYSHRGTTPAQAEPTVPTPANDDWNPSPDGLYLHCYWWKEPPWPAAFWVIRWRVNGGDWSPTNGNALPNDIVPMSPFSPGDYVEVQAAYSPDGIEIWPWSEIQAVNYI